MTQTPQISRSDFIMSSLCMRDHTTHCGRLCPTRAEPYSLIPSRTNIKAGNIELDGISFRYSDNHPWLYRNLSITIKPNKCTVLMGPSGCGKSTLAKLLLGFYQPQEGNIKIDGKDIRHLSANELRNYFGILPQETMLFSGTLYENEPELASFSGS